MGERGKEDERERRRKFLVGLARAFGGAVFFALPLLMTMEMWWLGFYLGRFQLVLFMLVMAPFFIGLAHYSGFKETMTWVDDAVDAAVAYGVGLIASAVVLVLFDVVRPSMPPGEVIGKLALESVPAGFGAVLANSVLAGSSEEETNPGRERERQQETGYPGEVFFMAAGAIFFAFNVAPTEEMVLIAYRMTEWHALALAALSIAGMHAFVFAVDFRGQHRVPEGTPWWRLFLRFTVVGYAVALVLSAYVLWTFGRFDGAPFELLVIQSVVLGFPASLGAAAARLIL